MPDNQEIAQVFEGLVTNGLDFIERSAGELETALKFSVAHFATGLELLLKARLLSEHWSLISSDPHSCTWTAVKDGTIHTIQASDLCSAITSSTGTPLKEEKVLFGAIFNHRNRVLHWMPADGASDAAAEQCRAWYRLHRLLTVTWKDQFSRFQTRVDAVEKTLLVYKTYLNERYGALRNKLKGAQVAGKLFACPACAFDSGVLAVPELSLSDFSCEVCRTSGHVARFACGAWFTLDDLPLPCGCGVTHTRGELLEDLDPTPTMSPKEQSTYEPNIWHCGECFDSDATVAPVGDAFQCVACGAKFTARELSHCECCNERWAGYNTEFSYHTGCECCDGHDPD